MALRHAKSEPVQAIMQFGNVRLDIDKRLVTLDSVEVHLTPIEYEAFKQLAIEAGRVLTHHVLLNRVWASSSRKKRTICGQ